MSSGAVSAAKIPAEALVRALSRQGNSSDVVRPFDDPDSLRDDDEATAHTACASPVRSATRPMPRRGLASPAAAHLPRSGSGKGVAVLNQRSGQQQMPPPPHSQTVLRLQSFSIKPEGSSELAASL